VSLELGDIDWVTGQIRVRGKNGQRNDLPLPADVGEAIDGEIRSISAMLESRFVCAVSRSGLGLFSLWICGMQVEATNFHMR
jgi:hypothetical protein